MSARFWTRKAFESDTRRIIGLMSGTSCDGLDIGIFDFAGFGQQARFETVHFETVALPSDLKRDVLSVLGSPTADLMKLTILNARFGIFSAQSVLDVLDKVGIAVEDITCIASHGQTVYHAPFNLHHIKGFPNATLQIGDGDHLAHHTGILTLSDFRQKHLAAGGEGAPLAPYADYALFSSDSEDRILLNIGGIANFTYLGKSDYLASDTGPGNTLLNALTRKYFNKEFDHNGDLARKGEISEPALKKLMASPFMQEKLPKSTGQELFNLNWFLEFFEERESKNPYTLLATALEFTVASIIQGISETSWKYGNIYVSGGGMYNLYLMEKLSARLAPSACLRFDELGISGEAKESLVFAFLANENFSESSVMYPWEPSVLTMGKWSFPQ